MSERHFGGRRVPRRAKAPGRGTRSTVNATLRRAAYGTPGISAAARYAHAAPGYLLATVQRISREPTGTPTDTALADDA